MWHLERVKLNRNTLEQREEFQFHCEQSSEKQINVADQVHVLKEQGNVFVAHVHERKLTNSNTISYGYTAHELFKARYSHGITGG